ncbi:class I adenylate-forming enzyme family protein [Streptomyces viridosporus]|uniref:class I adenylate-forming enzyme family protein n=1 Tax=Streptomyces viridosporus TaxID=67581 RepID=UPI0009BF0D26|nr:AMP-binding protein [Streptomyces viridosporus]
MTTAPPRPADDAIAPVSVRGTRSGNLVELLEESARAHGRLDRTAYLDESGEHSFRSVYEGAGRAAAAFAAHGLGPGSRILIALPDGIDFVRAFLGAVRIGAVAIPVNSMFHPDEMARAGRIAEPAAVVAPPELEGLFTAPVLTADRLSRGGGAVPPYADCAPRTPAFAAFTSGTTGDPKLCFHTHADAEVLDRAAGRAIGVTEDDVCYSVPRMNFAYGLGNSLFFPLLRGAATVLTARRQAPADCLALLARHGVSVYYSQPTFFAHLLAHPDAEGVLGRLRVAVVAGEVLPRALERRLRHLLGERLLNVYGTTEIGHALLANGAGAYREFTLGRVLAPYRLRIVDERGRPVAAGTEGRLELAGPTIGPGVARGSDVPLRTAPEEWYATSDAATADSDGFVTVHGRLDDVEIVGGVNVHPGEIEDRLMEHPAVKEAAVCAVRHDNGVSALRAFVVLRAGVDARPQGVRQALLTTARTTLTWYKVPEDVVFVASLPRNHTGKLLRRAVRARAAGGSFQP